MRYGSKLGITQVLVKDLKTNFIRKEFEDFSYLTVDPPFWAIITTYILTLLITVGMSYWAVNNDISHHTGRYR